MFVKANPDQAAPVQKAITAQLSGPVQIYVRRMLEQRQAGDNPCKSMRHSSESEPAEHHRISAPSRAELSKSPTRPQSYSSKPLPRKSHTHAPRPSSVAVDKAAPLDAQLSHYKNIFAKASQSYEGSPNGKIGNGNGNGEPLSEISPQISADVD